MLNPQREVAKELKEVGVDKISVSLNAPDAETYEKICKPTFKNAFQSVLDFIAKAKQFFDVEITAVTVPEVNVSKVKEVADRIGVKFRVRQYIPCVW